MARKLLIAGKDRWRDYEHGTMQIEQALTYEIDTCRFQVRGEKPTEGEEVIIEDDNYGRLFAGIIVRVELARVMPDKSNCLWQVDCDDYTALLDRRLVAESYQNMSASEIFLDIVAKYCPGFTTNGVRPGAPVIESTGAEFEYKCPGECFRWLCDYTGWHWQPDYFKDLHFFSAEEFVTPAPMALTPGGKFRFGKHSIDRQGLRNRVYVCGGAMLSDPQVVQWKADGVARIWALPWPPHEVDFKVGEAVKTVGVENLHEEADFDYMMSFAEKYIRCSSQTSTPAEGTTMSLTARQDIPVITMVEDYASQSAIAKVQGGDGIYEHVISDDSLTSIAAAEAAGMADLREHSNPRVKGSFETEYTKPESVPTALDYTESGEDFEEGELDGVVVGEDGLELEEVESPTFTRNSKAYLSDGTEVDAGVPRFEQGKFDKAVLVEEGTTNLCTNPSFETDLTGWAHLGGGTSSRVTDQKYYGNACLKISTTDTENVAQRWYAVANPGNYAGKTVSFSCMVKTSIADKLRLCIREYDGNTYNWSKSSPRHPGDGTWKKLSLTTTLRSTVTDLQLQIIAEAGIIGDFWCDGVLFEEKPYPTSFTPSTRSPETLTIPTAGVLNPQEGAVAFWYKTGRSSSIAPSGKHDNFFGLDSKLWNIYQRNGVENELRFMVRDSWGEPNIQIAVNWDEGDILFIVARWKLPDIYLDVWNYTKGTYAFGSATGVTYTGSPTLAYVNCGFGDFAGYNNGLIDELAIFDYAPTDEEIQAWHEADAPIPITEHTTYLLRFDNDFVVGKGGARKSLPLDLSSVGTVKTSEISWQATEPTDTSLKVETSLSTDSGETWGAWQQATNGGSIPGIVPDMDLSNAKLKTRATLETEDTSVTPALNNLTINLTGEKLEPRIWQPGQIVEINLPDRGIQGEYLIQRVTTSPLTPKLWTFRVEYGGRLFGIADFLQALVSAQQKRRYMEPTKNVQKYIYGEETLELSDALTAASRTLPFICGDSDAICGMVVVSDG